MRLLMGLRGAQVSEPALVITLFQLGGEIWSLWLTDGSVSNK